jgi:hypothetical protein
VFCGGGKQAAVAVGARNLAIEDDAIDLQMLGKPVGEFSKTAKHVPVTCNQLPFSIRYLRQRSKAVDLQLV